MKRMLSFRANPNYWGVEKSSAIKKTVKKSFLIFGATDSSDRQSRSVQIARKLSEKVQVTYIEGVFDVGSKPGARIIETNGNITALRLTAKKSIHFNYQNPTSKEIAFLKQSFKFINPLTRELVNPLIYLHHSFWSLITSLKKNSFYFDNAHDFIHTNAAGSHIIAADKKCLKTAEVVTAPVKKLLRIYQKKGIASVRHPGGGRDPVSHHNSKNNNVFIPNGVDWDAFKDTSKMIQTCDVGLCWIKKPVMGYIGTLDEKIDEELLGKLAAAFPSASIVLVGNTDYRPVIEVAEKSPNIFPVGKQPYKKLPLFLQSFDILIVPFKYNKSTVFNHPEFPLYLASGKPIVATALAACASAKGLYYAPKSHADWTLAISDALKERRRSKLRSLRIASAKKLSWGVVGLMNK